MPDILHRVGANVEPQVAYAALATIDGLAHWWTTATTGDSAIGGVIDFGFCRMRVERSEPGRVVQWVCVGGPDEWVGTSVSFELAWRERETIILFKHAGWREPVEFMHHCSTKWAIFLMSLRNWLERGEGHPAPYDVKIHVGD
ncbi:MAG: SRPBCC domain-containing protein [Gemmatimonadetes bacterium]|nr:SRPBCC domain-containing protein [Gemmatimonadota bacterium]